MAVSEEEDLVAETEAVHVVDSEAVGGDSAEGALVTGVDLVTEMEDSGIGMVVVVVVSEVGLAEVWTVATVVETSGEVVVVVVDSGNDSVSLHKVLHSNSSTGAAVAGVLGITAVDSTGHHRQMASVLQAVLVSMVRQVTEDSAHLQVGSGVGIVATLREVMVPADTTTEILNVPDIKRGYGYRNRLDFRYILFELFPALLTRYYSCILRLSIISGGLTFLLCF